MLFFSQILAENTMMIFNLHLYFIKHTLFGLFFLIWDERLEIGDELDRRGENVDRAKRN